MTDNHAKRVATTATAFLNIIAGGASIEWLDGDARVVTIGGRRFVISVEPGDLADGSVFQTPSCLPLPGDTVEGALQREIEARISGAVGHRFTKNTASLLVRMLAVGVWDDLDAAVSETNAVAKAARNVSINRRGELARITSKAFDLAADEGVKRVAQAIQAAPVLPNLVEESELAQRIVNGESPRKILSDHGANRFIARLSKNAAVLINQDNIERACAALGAVNPNQLPTGRKQKDWLRKMLAVSSVAEPAEGFFDWLSVHTAKHQRRNDINVAIPVFAVLEDWAAETAGQQNGWNEDKGLPACLAAALAWSERQQKGVDKFAAAQPDFSVLFGDYYDEDAKLFVCQIKTAVEMVDAGDHLDNCLKTLTRTFVEQAHQGARLYVTTRNPVTHGDKLIASTKPITAAELERAPNGAWVIRQHYGRNNQSAPEAHRLAIRNLLNKLNEANQ